MIRRFGVQLSEVHIAIGGLLILAVVFSPLPLWAKIVLSLLIAAVCLVKFDGWLPSYWLGRVIATRRTPQEPVPSEAELGAIAFPGEDVATRWEGDELVALVAVTAALASPTVVVAGQALHKDVIDTRLVQESLRRSGLGPDGVCADIVSAGWRVSPTAPAPIFGWGQELLGADPAPGLRRSWIEVRVNPQQVLARTRWRGEGLEAVCNAAVSAATRIADDQAAAGVDARPAASFELLDELTGRGEQVVEQQWSALRLEAGYTTVFAAPGGPDVWWSQRAVRTVTRTRVRVGEDPQSVVALTTLRPIERDPAGWTRLRGVQLPALRGQVPVAGEHHRLPVGSAGVLVGRTALDGAAVYVPFDAAEMSLLINNEDLALRMAVRACAAGAQLHLPQTMATVAAALGVPAGPQPHYRWPGSGVNTWLTPRAEVEITLSPLSIVLPFAPHQKPKAKDEEKAKKPPTLPLQAVNAREEAVIGIRLSARSPQVAAVEDEGQQMAGNHGKWNQVIERRTR